MIKQYDIFEYKKNYIANIQAVTGTKTNICCLISKEKIANDLTCINVKIHDDDFTLLTSQIFTLESSKLKNKVDNIKKYRDKITNALDRLLYQESYPL